MAEGELVIDSGNRELMSHRQKDQCEGEGLLYYQRIVSIMEVTQEGNDSDIPLCSDSSTYMCISGIISQ